MENLRQEFIRIASVAPATRAMLVPLIRQAGKWNNLPKGWTQDSVDSFWESLTGDSKHKVTKCIERMDGKFDDPGAFCASLADKVMGPEWRKKKAAAQFVLVKELPPAIRAVLKEVRYGRRDISISPATKYQIQYPADNGMRGFTAAVNLVTGQYKLEWGSWGGANMFNPRNQVDLDSQERPLPLNGAIVQGESGGRGAFASIYVHPGNLQALLPSPENDSPLSPQERSALNIIGSLISSYRTEAFERAGLGAYGPNNPHIQSLAKRGLVQVSARGVAITTQGRNMRMTARERVAATRSLHRQAKDTALTGKTFENESLRFHVYRGSVKVWDLTNAGKRGKVVEGFALYDTDFVWDPSVEQQIDQWTFRLRSLTYNAAKQGALAFADMGVGAKFHTFQEKGIRVAPAGVKPIRFETAEVSVRADLEGFSVQDKSDPSNLPTCIERSQGGRASIPVFFRWLQDNLPAVKRMTYQEILAEMTKMGIVYHSYCAMGWGVSMNATTRIATRYLQRKRASNLHQALWQVFARMEPLTRNYRGFIEALAEWMVKYAEERTWEITQAVVTLTDTVYREGPETYQKTWENPAEYAEVELEVPAGMDIKGKMNQPVRDLIENLSRHLRRAYAPQNEKAIKAAFAEVFSNHAALNKFGELLAGVLQAEAMHVGIWDNIDSEPVAWEAYVKALDSQAEGRLTTPDKVVSAKVDTSVSNGILFTIQATLEWLDFDHIRLGDFDPDYDYDP